LLVFLTEKKLILNFSAIKTPENSENPEKAEKILKVGISVKRYKEKLFLLERCYPILPPMFLRTRYIFSIILDNLVQMEKKILFGYS
jgi:hypothetical protein